MRTLLTLALFLATACAAYASEIAPWERGTFAKLRSAHAGRPLVVHFWSVTCIPCLTEMPRLAVYARENPDVDLVFVATDPIAQTPRIESRLEKFGLSTAKNFAYADAFEERLRFEVDRTWRGELPFTTLIRADGAMTSVVGELEPDALLHWRDTASAR